jgi:hypothetical protein
MQFLVVEERFLTSLMKNSHFASEVNIKMSLIENIRVSRFVIDGYSVATPDADLRCCSADDAALL